MNENQKHCDDYIDDPTQPECLREFLRFQRMSAMDRAEERQRSSGHINLVNNDYRIYATYNGVRVALTMASRFGDVGISYSTELVYGYDNRVAVEELADFSWGPK